MKCIIVIIIIYFKVYTTVTTKENICRYAHSYCILELQ